MAIRTTSILVQGVLRGGGDYGPNNNGELPSLIPYIIAASALVDQIAYYASSTLTTFTQRMGTDTATLTVIETWLSAHLYCMSDQTMASKSTGGASGSFHGQTGMNLDATKYGQSAKLLDYSGVLTALEKRAIAGGYWMGKPPSEQIAYSDRD